MKIEDQVVSLGLAKRLKELGVKQESFLTYSMAMPKDDCIILSSHIQPELAIERYAAFTVAELGEMFKGYSGDGLLMNMLGAVNGYQICIADMESEYYPTVDSWVAHYVEDSEADARANMLIYLIENNLITV